MTPETCTCESKYPLVLQWHSSEHPIVCSNCNLEAEVENIPNALKQKIDAWNKRYEVAYRKWLEDDEAIGELQNPNNELNMLGLFIVSELNDMNTPFFYWWHMKEDEKLENCPKCNGFLEVLLNYKLGINKVCPNCRILIRE